MKSTKKIFTCGIFLALFTLMSCDIIDSINTLPINFGVSVQISLIGSTTSVSQSGTIDLNNSDTYKEYASKIKSKTLKEAAFRTISLSPADLSGTVAIIIEFGGNTITKNLGTVKPSDYISTPLIIVFTADEMSKINTYLNENISPVFKATINATGMPAGQKSMTISIDAVFEAVTEF